MRLLMMGTGPFAVPTFESLLESSHEIVGLVTRPTPPVKSRGKSPPNPMREVAEARGVRVLSPDSVNAEDTREQLAALHSELFVVCDYGQILSAETLALTELGGINLHGSLLPKYRGAAPVQWAILNGETETGVSVIHMTPKLDAGPVLTLRKVAIESEETAAELEPRLAQLGVEAVHESLALLAEWDGHTPLGQPQDATLACRAPRLKRSDGEVDWSRTAQKITNQVRGLQPWPGTFTHFQRGDQRVRLILEEVRPLAEPPEPGPPGTVLVAAGERLWVAAGQGAVAIQRLKPAGKRVLSVSEFLRGYPLQPGTMLQ